MQLQLTENIKNEIILYQPNDSVKIEVILEDETVWLTQVLMAGLFQTSRANITMHIANIFKEGELDEKVVCKNFLLTTQHGAIAGKTQTVRAKIYNLDVIISVGYRVKSLQGTHFRIWANCILKEYLLRGYAINQRLERLEYRMAETEKKVDFFVKTALPPVEGIFYDGQILESHSFVAELIKSAKKSIILIDNYIDETVLLQLSKRENGVEATIYTLRISDQLQLDIDKHNAEYEPITVKTTSIFHDRFLIIDDTTIYNIGASLKNLGKKLFSFNKMNLPKEIILEKL
ncbi:MAG: virulence RhuM family protein [Prevotellaceae bacterium]|jgi:hypothetical protein|nr:virulence RhuM family protein [Prevotellaceae bacterium]